MRTLLDLCPASARCPGPGRRLAAVARPEARRRLARDRHPRQVPRRAGRRSSGGSRAASATPARPSRRARCSSPTASSATGPTTRRTRSPDRASPGRIACSAWTRRPARSCGSSSTRSSTASATPAGPRCTPTVDGDRVFWLGTMGDLFALDATTGKPVWYKNFIKDYGRRAAGLGLRRPPARRRRQAHLPGRRVGGPGRGRVRQEDRQGDLDALTHRSGDLGLQPAGDLRVQRQARADHLARARGRRARPGDGQEALAVRLGDSRPP